MLNRSHLVTRAMRAALALAAVLVGCGGDGDGQCTDGATMPCDLGGGRAGERVCGSDSRWSSACVEVLDGGLVDVPWLAEGVPPIAPPALSPCPDGWREVPPEAAGDPVTCDPYPEGGSLECPAGQAHFAGEPGCVPVGSPCPVGDFADGLPADRSIVYVQPGATAGDGTEAMPYASLSDFALGGLPPGSVIALSRGTHLGPVRLLRAHELVGACAGATLVRATGPTEFEAVITLGTGGVARDLTVSDSPRPGVRVEGAGSEGRLSGVIVERVQSAGVEVIEGGHLSAQSVVIRDTAASSEGDFGHGLDVFDASADVSRALISGNRDAALFANGSDTRLVLADVVIRDTLGQASDDLGGRGLNVQLGATADLSRTLISGNRELGLFVGGTASASTLTDVVVRDTESQDSDGRLGRGLSVISGATARVERGLFVRNRDGGVTASQAGTTLTLIDVVIRDTEGHAIDGRFGRGIGVQFGAAADASRALIAGNREVGVYAADPDTALTLADVVVRDTRSRGADGTSGRGMNIQLAAQAEVARGLVERNRELGVVAFAGATASFEDVAVLSTLRRDCFETTCSDAGAGHGVGGYGSGTAVLMTRFSVRGGALCGLHLADGAEIDLAAGEIRDHPIGVCLQVEGYDVARLTTGVAYVNNELNLQSTSLPVPEPIGD